MKALIGWLLFLIGLGGLIANLLVTIRGDASGVLIVNSLVCLLFIYLGWRLSHQAKMVRG